MCLEYITGKSSKGFETKQPNGVLYGWKVFEQSCMGTNLISECILGEAYREKIWYEAKRLVDMLTCERNTQQSYAPGFHAYVDDRPTQHHKFNNKVVRRVQLKGVYIKGIQRVVDQYSLCYVAQHMFIEPEEK